MLFGIHISMFKDIGWMETESMRIYRMKIRNECERKKYNKIIICNIIIRVHTYTPLKLLFYYIQS